MRFEMYGEPGTGITRLTNGEPDLVIDWTLRSSAAYYNMYFGETLQFTPMRVKKEFLNRVVEFLGSRTTWIVDAAMSDDKWVGVWLSPSSLSRMNDFSLEEK